MDKVIIIGCNVPGYAVIRALANKGLYIIALTYARSDFAHLSKYVDEVAYTCPPDLDEEGFITTLLTNSDNWNGALILETSDAISIAISRNKKKLAQYYKIVTPDWDVLKIFVEKEKTYELAKKCEVPHPQSFYLKNYSDFDKVEKFNFPYILKPVRSFEFISVFNVKNFRVDNEIELKNKYMECHNAGIPVILQEVIPGPDDNLYKLQGYINSKGLIVGKFFHKKVRQNPPMFGVMRVGVSTERYPDVERYAETLLNYANYKGYFSIEFKMDYRDNKLKLMENNCRMPRSGLLSIASGVNYPWIIFLDHVRNQQIDVTDYKYDFYWIELLADISNTIKHHKEEDISLRDYAKPYFAKNRAFSDLDLQDLKPFRALVFQKMKSLKRRLTGRENNFSENWSLNAEPE